MQIKHFNTSRGNKIRKIQLDEQTLHSLKHIEIEERQLKGRINSKVQGIYPIPKKNIMNICFSNMIKDINPTKKFCFFNNDKANFTIRYKKMTDNTISSYAEYGKTDRLGDTHYSKMYSSLSNKGYTFNKANNLPQINKLNNSQGFNRYSNSLNFSIPSRQTRIQAMVLTKK